ncbi:MAG TPA: autotransporter-associated beta strand repeat-containing protein [Verrucomicrobium sp.]|nr:autotransporter-associated beta strand repeat-containing protein [Verrucomicrobium sp.]
MHRTPSSSLILIMAAAVVSCVVQAQAQTIYYQERFEGDSFGAAGSDEWFGYWNTTAQDGVSTGNYREGILSGGSYTGAGSYVYAQTQAGGTSMNYLLTSRESTLTINPASYAADGLFVNWDKFGSTSPYRFTVQVGGIWYASATLYSSTNTALDLLNAEWYALTLSPGTALSLGSTLLDYEDVFGTTGTISNVGFYLAGLASGGTMRFNNIEIYNKDVDRYTWRGATGVGGNGTWDTLDDVEWGGLWRNHRIAVFGGASDAGTGGTVTINSSQSLGAAGLRFEAKANGYILQAATTSPSKTLALTGNIYLDPAASATFTNGLLVSRADDNLSIGGGGRLNIQEGASLRSTASKYLSIHNGSTVDVRTGGSLTATNSIIVGSTVAGGTSGSATLLVTGGLVQTDTTGTGGNFILGNRSSVVGDVTVTISAGEIIGNGRAANGFAFENTGASSAYFNLNGGVVTMRRILRVTAGGSPAPGEDSFLNFNGGVLRVDATGGSTTTGPVGSEVTVQDADNAKFAFLQNTNTITYRVLEGGAIIDTNGRNILIEAPLVSAAADDGGFTKRGTGTLLLHGSNTYNGGTVIEGGTLSIRNSANLGTNSGPLAIRGGATLAVTDDVDLGSRVFTIGDESGGGNATVDVAAEKELDYHGAIAQNAGAASSLTKTGGGNLHLAGASSYTGKTMVAAGTVSLTMDSVFGDTAASLASNWIEVATGAKFDTTEIDLFGTAPYSYTADTLSGSGTFAGNALVGQNTSIRIGGTSSGNQGMTNLLDAGNLIGTLAFDGDLTVEGSSLYFQIGGTEAGQSDFLNVVGAFTASADTHIVVEWANAFTATAGQSFDLIDWGRLGDPDWGGFDSAALADLLPELGNASWYWDTSDFLESGVIRVAPEPGRSLLLAFALCVFLTRRRKPGHAVA